MRYAGWVNPQQATKVTTDEHASNSGLIRKQAPSLE
jgi:hypothetical protein